MVLHLRQGEMISGAIAARFNHSWPTITRHRRVLQDAGLIHVERRGREQIHGLGAAPLRDVAGGWIDRFASE